MRHVGELDHGTVKGLEHERSDPAEEDVFLASLMGGQLLAAEYV